MISFNSLIFLGYLHTAFCSQSRFLVDFCTRKLDTSDRILKHLSLLQTPYSLYDKWSIISYLQASEILLVSLTYQLPRQ